MGRLVADGVTVNALLDAINNHEKNSASAITAAQLTAELSKAGIILNITHRK